MATTAELGVPLLMMALVGMLAYEFQVTLPVFAKHVFHGGAETFGVMTAAMGVGAVSRRLGDRGPRAHRHAGDGRWPRWPSGLR